MLIGTFVRHLLAIAALSFALVEVDPAIADPFSVIEHNATTDVPCIRVPSAVAGGTITTGTCNPNGTNPFGGALRVAASMLFDGHAGGMTIAPQTLVRPTQASIQGTISALDFCTLEAIAADATNCLNQALAAASKLGKTLNLPAATYNIAGTLKWAADGVGISGEFKAGRSTAGTSIVFLGKKGSAITVGASTGGFIRNVRIDASARTEGAPWLAVTGVSGFRASDVTGRFYQGVSLYATNDVSIDNVNMYGTGGAGTYGLYWWGDQKGTRNSITGKRADVLSTVNVTMNMQGLGGDGYRWDGLAATWIMHATRSLGSRYGLWVTNHNGDADNFPGFLEAHGYENDGGSKAGVRIDAGRSFHFYDSDVDSSPHDASFLVNADHVSTALPDGTVLTASRSPTYTSDVQFIGGRIGNSLDQCVFSTAQDVDLIGVHYSSCSLSASGAYPAVDLVSPAQRTTVIGGRVSAFGDAVNTSYGVRIGSRVDYVKIFGLETGYAVNGAVQNNSDAKHISILDDDQLNLAHIGLNNIDADFSLRKSKAGSPLESRVQNDGTTDGTQARLRIATGSPDAYAIIAGVDGHGKELQIATGAGYTNGIELAPSAGPIKFTGLPQFAGGTSVGSTAASLGRNCPAVTCSAPYTWVRATLPDGSAVFLPVYK